jgi:cellulose synthase/poly-beta-1,6-N-acetylglucosamine synthase-like glycosyltransferase
MHHRSYALVSACRDEADYVDGLIDAVAAQAVQPLRWVIVDDGSMDGTYERVLARSRRLGFLEVARMPAGRPRSFSSKVYAVQHGCELVKGPGFELIGFLDADVRFGPDYYRKLFERFEADARLGLAGGMVVDQYAHRNGRIRSGSEEYHVPGGVQLFRRECFEQVGGYVPVELGGEDTIADVTAMMRGWRVRTFPELEVRHLRPEGCGKGNVLIRGMRWGRWFYLLGYHPLYYLGQCVRRLSCRPVVIGSACNLLGFIVAYLKGGERPVSVEYLRFQRTLQMRRVRQTLTPGWLARG